VDSAVIRFAPAISALITPAQRPQDTGAQRQATSRSPYLVAVSYRDAGGPSAPFLPPPGRKRQAKRGGGWRARRRNLKVDQMASEKPSFAHANLIVYWHARPRAAQKRRRFVRSGGSKRVVQRLVRQCGGSALHCRIRKTYWLARPKGRRVLLLDSTLARLVFVADTTSATANDVGRKTRTDHSMSDDVHVHR